MADEILYRPATMDDIRPAYAVFSRSLHQYLFQQGLIDEITAKDPPIGGIGNSIRSGSSISGAALPRIGLPKTQPVAFSVGQ